MSTGAGLNVSKANAYTVLEKPLALNVSKANAYTVLEKPLALNVSKANAYTVLEKPLALNVSKANVYLVLVPVPSNPPVWPSFSFGNGTTGTAYSQQFDLAPAASPITYTLETGALPTGLNLNNSGGTAGSITGTPTAAGSYTFTVRATNTYGFAISQPFTIEVIAPYGIPEPVQKTLAKGVVGSNYSDAITVQGGTGPFTFAISAGELPDGLSLDASTGSITGTPTTAETSSFTVSVTGLGNNTGYGDFSITIAPLVQPVSQSTSATAANGTTLLLDQTEWDLVLDASGNIAMASPPYSLAQDVASAVRTFLGEVYYDTTQGIPYWAKILGKLPPSSLLIELINKAALTVPGVVAAQTYITSFNDRELSGQIQFTDDSGTSTTVNF